MAVGAAIDRQKNPRTAAGELGTSFAVLLLEFGGRVREGATSRPIRLTHQEFSIHSSRRCMCKNQK